MNEQAPPKPHRRNAHSSPCLEGQGTSGRFVDEGAIQVSQALLQRDARNRSRPCHLWVVFESGKQCREIAIRKALACLPIRLAFQVQCPIVDISAASKRASKYALLLVCRIASVFVCALDPVHILPFFLAGRKQETAEPLSPPTRKEHPFYPYR